MLRDRACREGGWNAGNSIVFGAALAPYIDTTAIALMAFKDGRDPVAVQGLKWMRQALPNCPSVYSLAWASIPFSVHRDQAFDPAIIHLSKALSSSNAIDTETLGLAAIALLVAEGRRNPFDVAV